MQNTRKNDGRQSAGSIRYQGVLGTGVGWPDRPARAVGSRSDKRLRRADAIAIRAFILEFSRDGAASCRCATRPVLRTRPGHPRRRHSANKMDCQPKSRYTNPLIHLPRKVAGVEFQLASCARVIVVAAFIARCLASPALAGSETDRFGRELALQLDQPEIREVRGRPANAVNDDEPATAAAPPRPIAKNAEPKWLDSLARGYTEAQRQQRPIFVKVGSETCRFCRELAVTLEKPAIREELKRWTLVAIDIDKSPDDARLLAVGPIPALRALTSSGRVVAEEEGALKADILIQWLKENFEQAASISPDDLDHDEPPDAAAVGRLIQAFRNRDAVIREAVIRKLLPHPDLAAAQVVEAFADGSLTVRLAALDLLVEWKAPAERLDPWRKETLTEARLKSLSEWAATARSAEADPRELDPADLAAARQMIDHMLSGPAGEIQAIRERLARYGRLLLPDVYDRLKAAPTDEARERLTMLRYRLVESQTLALKWSGGIERLSAADPEIRLRAADELAGRATTADEPLLLELFSDPTPLVREISLRALRQAGGENVNSALLRLLDDPDPNVRAAVLKHLAEAPSPAAATRIVSYVEKEPDWDLVVHAVRVLREIPGNTTKTALMSLLEHESWRVRAEAAEALGKKIPRYGGSKTEFVDIYMAMVELLKDQDGFVVSRAVETLAQADLVAAVDPLVAAAEAHPEMAVEVVKALGYGQKQRQKADVHLRRFADHADPRLRAAAIVGLTMQPGIELADDVRKALGDENGDVRIAAANGFFGILENRRRSDDANVIMGLYRDATTIPESTDDGPATEDEWDPLESTCRHASLSIL